MTWSELPLSSKSELMRIYLKNGISSLDDMKEHYNSYATGGNMSSPDEPPESEDNKIYQSIWNISKEENPNGQKERLEIIADNNYVKPYTAVLRTYPYFHKNYVISHSALRAYRDGFDNPMDPVSVSKYFDDSDYNLFNNNCSDATGEALNLDTKGLTTPKYIREQVLKKHPDAKERTRKDNVIFTRFPISKAEYDRIKAEQIKQTRINNGEVSEDYSIKDALHDNIFATGGSIETKTDWPPKRVRHNDSLTQKQSEAMEDRTARHIKNYQSDKIDHSYDIPYIAEKEIVVPGIGRVSTNALDSIAKYSYMAEIPLEEGLGLAAQETVFGAIPFLNYGNDVAANRALGNTSYFRNYGSIPANYLVRDWHYFDLNNKQRANTPPLLDAFKYWKAGKYNTKDKSHTTDVRNKGKQIIQTAPIQTWMQTSKYVKKKKK